MSGQTITDHTTAGGSQSSPAATKPSSDPYYGQADTAQPCAKFTMNLFLPAAGQTPNASVPNSDSKRPGYLPLDRFIAYALYRTRLHSTVTATALLLLQRLKGRFLSARASSCQRLFLAAFMVASKVVGDDSYSYKSAPREEALENESETDDGTELPGHQQCTDSSADTSCREEAPPDWLRRIYYRLRRAGLQWLGESSSSSNSRRRFQRRNPSSITINIGDTTYHTHNSHNTSTVTDNSNGNTYHHNTGSGTFNIHSGMSTTYANHGVWGPAGLPHNSHWMNYWYSWIPCLYWDGWMTKILGWIPYYSSWVAYPYY